MCALVTGVQTCALPICGRTLSPAATFPSNRAERRLCGALRHAGLAQIPVDAGRYRHRLAGDAAQDVLPWRMLATAGVGMRNPDGRQAEIVLEDVVRSEEHTSELQSLMRNSYAVFCLKQKYKTEH